MGEVSYVSNFSLPFLIQSHHMSCLSFPLATKKVKGWLIVDTGRTVGAVAVVMLYDVLLLSRCLLWQP